MKENLGCLALLLCVSPALASLRVALVSSGRSDSSNQAISLAITELADEKDIEWVDRQSINSILQEQHLALSGLVDPEKMTQAGQLLKADLFAVVETDPNGGRALGVVIFDSASGLRLFDAAIGGTIEQAAQSIVAAVEAAAKKDKALNQGVRWIGFSPVRNADLPPDRDVFCDTVRLLLERQLTASPGIAVLERSRLEQVNKERQLPTSSRDGNLLTSVVVVQLEISRGPGGRGLKVSATLTGASGQTQDKLTAAIDGDSPADLAERIETPLVNALKAPPIDQPFDRRQEARRFARDSQVLIHNSRIASGAVAGEAAYALQPGNQNRLILSTALWADACQCLTPGSVNLTELQAGIFDPIQPSNDSFDRALGLASRALDLQRLSLNASSGAPHKGQWYLDYTGGEERITLLDSWCSRLNAADNAPPALLPRIAAFRSAANSYVLDYFDGWADSIKSAPRDLMNYNAEIFSGLSAAANAASSQADFLPVRDHLIHQWITCFDASWLPPKELWMESGLRQSEVMTALLDTDLLPSAHWKDFDLTNYHKSLGSVAAELNKTSSPVMQLYGLVAARLADPQSMATAAARDHVRTSFLRQLQDTLDRPGPTPVRTRMYTYIAAVDAIHLLSRGPQFTTGADIELLDMAVQRKQLIPYAALKLLLQGRNMQGVILDSPDQPRRFASALQKTLTLSAAADCHVLDGNADGVRQELTSELHDLHERYPDLGPEKSARPWESARLLVDANSLAGISQLEDGAQVHNDRIYFAGSGIDEHGRLFLQDFSLPLAGGPVTALGKATINALPELGPDGAAPADGFLYRLIQGSAVDDKNCYLSVRGQGVLAFPLDGGPVIRIDTQSGLPSNWTQSLATAGGDLYITSSADTGAYLIRWTPSNRSVHVRISSVRKDKRSSLDDASGLRFEFMTCDAPRNRLLLGVGEYGPAAGDNSRAGLWQMDIATGRLKRLLKVDGQLSLGELRGMDEKYLIAATTLWVVRYDLNQDRAEYLSLKPGGIAPVYIQNLHPSNQTIKGSGWAEPDEVHGGTRRVIDNWLWIGDPFSRISADAKTVELLDGHLTPGADDLGPLWTILPAAPGQVVLGDSKQLYVVALSKP